MGLLLELVPAIVIVLVGVMVICDVISVGFPFLSVVEMIEIVVRRDGLTAVIVLIGVTVTWEVM